MLSLCTRKLCNVFRCREPPHIELWDLSFLGQGGAALLLIPLLLACAMTTCLHRGGHLFEADRVDRAPLWIYERSLEEVQASAFVSRP